MNILTMTDFKKLCQQIAPVTFIFDTQNQPGGTNANLKVVSHYSDVAFMLSPNRICLKNEYGTLCFDRVKAIRYFDDKPITGAVFNIICGSSIGSSSHTSYTIIADSKNFFSKL